MEGVAKLKNETSWPSYGPQIRNYFIKYQYFSKWGPLLQGWEPVCLGMDLPLGVYAYSVGTWLLEFKVLQY